MNSDEMTNKDTILDTAYESVEPDSRNSLSEKGVQALEGARSTLNQRLSLVTAKLDRADEFIEEWLINARRACADPSERSLMETGLQHIDGVVGEDFWTPVKVAAQKKLHELAGSVSSMDDAQVFLEFLLSLDETSPSARQVVGPDDSKEAMQIFGRKIDESTFPLDVKGWEGGQIVQLFDGGDKIGKLQEFLDRVPPVQMKMVKEALEGFF